MGANNDNACDFHNIQDTIDSGASDTIRVASNKNYFESLTINNVSKELIGGYANCSQADLNITDLSKAFITGNNNDSVVEITRSNDLSTSEVTLRNLVVANGVQGIFVRFQNQVEGIIKLDGVRMFNNTESGLDMTTFPGSYVVVSVKNLIIDFNQNSGIKCRGSGSHIRIGGNSVIEDNKSTLSGGGLFIENSCQVDIFSPTIIQDNKALSNGGGIHVQSSGSLDISSGNPQCMHDVCLGELDSPVVFKDNQANSDLLNGGDGGAISVRNEGSEANIFNGKFMGNEASKGGAISASFGGNVIALAYESQGSPCWSPGSCLQFENNQAPSGGVVFVTGENAEITVFTALLTKNKSNFGVIGTISNNGKLSVLNSVIQRNGELNGNLLNRELFDIDVNNGGADSTLELNGVTISDNLISQEIFDNNEGNLSVASSLIFDTQDVYTESGVGSSSHFECVIAHENSSFSAGGTVIVENPTDNNMFVNPLAGNYHLKVDSPAIDYCYEIEGTGGSDIDYDQRGSDNPDVDNLHGTYDIGADEFHINNDIIFKHGFEQD